MKNPLPILLFGALALTAALNTSCEKDADEPKQYSVAVTAGPGGAAEAKVDGRVASKAPAGAQVTLTATPDEGYLFARWTLESGEVELSGNPATFTMPAGDVSVKAEFTEADAPVYTIAVSTDGHGSAEASTGGGFR